jgi:hypothetical protein
MPVMTVAEALSPDEHGRRPAAADPPRSLRGYVLREMSVAVPFGDDGVQQIPLDDVGAERRRAAVLAVDPFGRRVTCSGRTELD